MHALSTNPSTAQPALTLAQRMHRAMRIANEAVISDVETNAYKVHTDGGTATWWDTQPMLDPREHGPEVVDMVSEAIQHGLDAGVLVRHPQQPHWYRIVRQPA